MDNHSLLVGLGVSTQVESKSDPVAEGRRAEDLGFDFVSSFDHLHGRTPTYEPWTVLSSIAAVTSRIRVLTRVLAVPHRNPAVLAKMAETLQRLSDGRLILGLGAGNVDEEFRALGLGSWSPRRKVNGLEEAIHILRGVWSKESFTFDGEVHHTHGAQLEPKPAKRIPIWLGTYGPRALGLTGQLADGWIPSLGYAPPEETARMRQRIISAARHAGRRPEDITMAYNVEVRLDRGSDSEPSVVSGSAEEVVERLLDFTESGFNVFNLIVTDPGRTEQVEQLAENVLPLLRSQP